MTIIYIDIGIVAVIIFFTIAFGLDFLVKIMQFVIDFQSVIVILFLVMVIVLNLGLFEDVFYKKISITKFVASICNVVLDTIKQISLFLFTMMGVYGFIDNVENNFIGMIIIGIPLLGLTLIADIVAIAGALAPTTAYYCLIEDKENTIGKMIIFLVINAAWTICFVILCDAIMVNSDGKLFQEIFDGTIYGNIFDTVRNYSENIIKNIFLR